MKIERFTCDNCGQVKLDSNHWFQVVDEAGVLKFAVWKQSSWVDQNETVIKHICGRECAGRLLEAWFNEK